jgi:hypothetical protein
MALSSESKARLRAVSEDPPEPRIARRHSWLWWALLAWIAAIALGHGIAFGWLRLPALATRRTVEPHIVTATRSTADVGQQQIQEHWPIDHAEAPEPTAEVATKAALAAPALTLPSCESVIDPDLAGQDTAEPLPVDLSRSPVGALLDSPHWIRPCRGPKATRVSLCLAVKEGRILGATATAMPRDAKLERCIVQAAMAVTLAAEASLRKVRLTIDLPPDR